MRRLPVDFRRLRLWLLLIFSFGAGGTVGAWLFGAYADRAGRRAALTLSVALMCGGSLMIAVIPTGFGVTSAALLLLARLLQGLSVGGEYGASATYLSEMAERHRRGLWSGSCASGLTSRDCRRRTSTRCTSCSP